MIGIDATKTAKQIGCAYCGDPTMTDKRTIADHKIYCGRLCAALGMIRDTDDDDGIDRDTGIDALIALVEESFLAGPVRIPKKVRECDIDAALRSLPKRAVMVVIDDEGTPDWIPELASDVAQEDIAKNEAHEEPSQAEIDQIVEDLLRNGPEAEDHLQ
jgi:hypothetical protein